MKNFSDMKIGICSDHAGYALKQQVLLFLEDAGAIVEDFGCYNEESCDYPDFAHPMAESLSEGKLDFGVAICTTGNGMQITCNKHHGVRAALCWEAELAELARAHNDANVLVLPAGFIRAKLALEITHIFFTTNALGDKHARRVSKIEK